METLQPHQYANLLTPHESLRKSSQVPGENHFSINSDWICYFSGYLATAGHSLFSPFLIKLTHTWFKGKAKGGGDLKKIKPQLLLQTMFCGLLHWPPSLKFDYVAKLQITSFKRSKKQSIYGNPGRENAEPWGPPVLFSATNKRSL